MLLYAGIRVTDLEKSRRFYTEALGLKEEKSGEQTHGGKWVFLEDPESHQRIELNWYPKGHLHDTPYVAGEGLDHIGFKVDNALSKYKELLAKGAESAAAPRVERGIEIIAYVKDPDGNWIEFFSEHKDAAKVLREEG